MTVTTTASVKQSTGNASWTQLSFPYSVLDRTHLIVTILNTTTLVVTTPTLDGAGTYDYATAVAADKQSATITFNNAPLAVHEVTARRVTAKTQASDYTENDDFPAATHEEALDKNVLIGQEIYNRLDDRAFSFSFDVNDPGETEITKTAAERANKVIGFDASGDIIATQELGTSRGSWATATAYNLRDIVKDGAANVYICITAHTSTGASPISTNADVAKWHLIVDGAAAAASAAAAAADLVLTNADVVLTHADVLLTNADVVLTNADVVLTNADVVSTNADVVTTTQDAIDTAADVVTTTQDAIDTAADLVATAADVVTTAANAAKLTGTSTTSLAIAVASKGFTTQASKFFTVGYWLLITSDADTTNYMHGQVTAYSGTSLTVNVTNIGGTGTFADWTISVSGTRGAIGSTGSTGSTGLTGATGAAGADGESTNGFVIAMAVAL